MIGINWKSKHSDPVQDILNMQKIINLMYLRPQPIINPSKQYLKWLGCDKRQIRRFTRKHKKKANSC